MQKPTKKLPLPVNDSLLRNDAGDSRCIKICVDCIVGTDGVSGDVYADCAYFSLPFDSFADLENAYQDLIAAIRGGDLSGLAAGHPCRVFEDKELHRDPFLWKKHGAAGSLLLFFDPAVSGPFSVMVAEKGRALFHQRAVSAKELLPLIREICATFRETSGSMRVRQFRLLRRN